MNLVNSSITCLWNQNILANLTKAHLARKYFNSKCENKFSQYLWLQTSEDTAPYIMYYNSEPEIFIFC